MRLKYWRAANLALDEVMKSDSATIVLGQDVASPGGTYGLTRGLLATYGPDRVKDAPISEAGLMACATGAAMLGMRPIVEIMFFDFLTLALDQLVNQAAKYRFFNPGDGTLPLVVQTMYGGRTSMGAHHSQSFEAWLCSVPGIQVAFPSSPESAYEVIHAAARASDPTVVVHPIANLRDEEECDLDASAEIGRSCVRRSGNDVTVVAYGPAVALCEAAISNLGVSAELIDLCWLRPWDETTVRESVKKTGRIVIVHDAVETGGYGAELEAFLTTNEFWSLRAPPIRVGARFSPIPVPARQWSQVLPSTSRVEEAIRTSLESD